MAEHSIKSLRRLDLVLVEQPAECRAQTVVLACKALLSRLQRGTGQECLCQELVEDLELRVATNEAAQFGGSLSRRVIVDAAGASRNPDTRAPTCIAAR